MPRKNSVACKVNGIDTEAVFHSGSAASYVHTKWTEKHIPNEVRPLAEQYSGQGFHLQLMSRVSM